MDHMDEGYAPAELGVGAWIRFWAELLVLALFAVLGASFASADRDPGDYACGLILALAAVALAFLRVRSRFDGAAADWGGSVLVDDIPNLTAATVIFTALGLAGLFIAAGIARGGLHDAGIALFLASGVAVFLSLKHVFDRLDQAA